MNLKKGQETKNQLGTQMKENKTRSCKKLKTDLPRMNMSWTQTWHERGHTHPCARILIIAFNNNAGSSLIAN